MKHFERLVAFLLVSSILAGCAVEAVIAPDRVEKDSLLLVDESTLDEIKDETERQAAENDLAFVRKECEGKNPDREITQIMRLKVGPELTDKPFSYYFCSSKKDGIQMPMIEAVFVDQEGTFWVGQELVGSANSSELETGHTYKEIGILGDGEIFLPIIQENLTTGEYIIHSAEEKVLINKDEVARLGLIRIFDAVMAIEERPEPVQTVKVPTLIPTETVQQPTQETEPIKSEIALFREMFGIESGDIKVQTFSVNAEGKGVFFRTVPGISGFEDSPSRVERLFIYENGVWRELERQSVDMGEQGRHLVQWYLDGVMVMKYDAYFDGAYTKLSLDQMKVLSMDVTLPLSLGGDGNPETNTTITLNELNDDVKRILVLGTKEKSGQQKAADAAEKTGYYVTPLEELKSNIEAFYRGEYVFTGEHPDLYRDYQEKVVPMEWFREYSGDWEIGKLSFIDGMAVLLGIYRDEFDSRQYMIFGSQREDGGRLVWGAVGGFLDEQEYPHFIRRPFTSQGGKYQSIEEKSNAQKLVDPDDYTRRLRSRVGKPVLFYLETNINLNSPERFCGVLNENECKYYYDSISAGGQMVTWMKGISGVPGYSIEDWEAIANLVYIQDIPLLAGVSARH